ncbi:hypothetical protein ACFSX5_13070 [Devosia albogilva]|uniref:Uncharacterized protein n=1 Tax=Devosia albogilva TaxID=429726 RepID=A0ABW5QM07_9HYPH
MRTIPFAFALLALTVPVAAQETSVSSDLSALPAPVFETYEALLDAARAGDFDGLEQVRTERGDDLQIGFGGAETITDFLTANSLSGDGVDAMAGLIEILESPYARVDAGDGTMFYMWPFLAGLEDLSDLPLEQRLEAYQLVDADALDDFAEYGGWLATRTIIEANGRWTAIVAGD